MAVRIYTRKTALKKLENQCDLYLVSFPKYGDFWVRFLFANYIYESEVSIDFKNLYTIVPDSHIPEQWDALERKACKELPVRIVKSHDPYLSFFKNKKENHIAREGKGALNSYFHYRNAKRIVELNQ